MAPSRKDVADAKKKLQSQLRTLREIEKRASGGSTQRSDYQNVKDRAAARASELSESGRDIGALPDVVDKERKDAAGASFRAFCDSYFPASFFLNWSPDHVQAIAKIEAAVLRGELYAFAMPRGSGKTTLVEAAAMWALFYGHRNFVAIVGADEQHASDMLSSIKVECESNDRILEDFPEVVYPIVALDRINNRARGQLYKGRPTNIEWKAEEIQLPTIPGSPASGGVIKVAGITGRIRGMSVKRAADGKKARPSLVLIDDPQTDESAASPSQVATREKVMSGAILGLAGPGQKIAGLCTITVIRTDDLADRLLDRSRHPSWQGERTRLVYEWPDRDDLWGQYAELRREGQRAGAGTAAADEFYRQHQGEMDAGSKVAWPERRNEDELTAIQHAWNLRIDRGESAFMAEYQNTPTSDDITSDKLDKRSLSLRAQTTPKGIVPSGHNVLTAFVDVQERLLFWLVASWSSAFGGHVVSYGTWPDQRSSFFEAAHAKRTLSSEAGGAGFEGSLRTGLDSLMVELMAKDWKREDGIGIRVSQLLVDANWGRSTQVVRNFAKASPWAANILPSHGRGIGASSQPLTEKSKHRGDRIGLNWRVGKIGDTDHRSALYDTNFWKTFAAARLRLAVGDPEALTLPAGDHELLLEHLTSEYPIRTEARGRVVDEWKISGRDNHWWDCLVGASVAASITGLQPTASEAGGRQRKKVSIPTGPNGKRVIVTKRPTQ